ncbi:hypothetical protein H8R05_02410 [Anaerotruncus massiliensis]|uniref:Uncharacterized protein n=1 Tax=Anaerotruncus massiliensis (ex Togo et al. 2019) TaxID=1673720 RepID=A0ABR7ABH0_9FIRM|nr:hypothetical protein [Anaerotruncus massiliensis (ex Togo et al. 2019)]
MKDLLSWIQMGKLPRISYASELESVPGRGEAKLAKGSKCVKSIITIEICDHKNGIIKKL